MITRSDVIVVGAGPAGAVAALVLAQRGARVTLVERKSIPREKVCGDGLLADSVKVLEEIGLWPRVRAQGHEMQWIRMYAPSEQFADMSGTYLTLQRERLDTMLVEAATRAGVTIMERAEARRFETENGTARVEIVGGQSTTLEAPLVILATGARTVALKRFNVDHRRHPSAVAMRAYYRLRPSVPEDRMHIWFGRDLLPGYGWIFPMGRHVFNVGAGTFNDTAKHKRNLRQHFDCFCSRCTAAHDMLAGGEQVTQLKGAPLRTGLEGARPSADRLLVAGEAIGTTYSLSGEGIGKAMHSGKLAAEAAMESLEKGTFSAESLTGYDRKLEETFRERFHHYQLAQSWLKRPWMINFIARKACRSESVLRMLEDIIVERRRPSELLSVRGLWRLLFAS